MRISVTLEGAAEAVQLLEATASQLEQPPRPLLESLAAALQTYLQTHIQTQTGPEGPWPPLAPATRKIRAYYGHPADGPALIRGATWTPMSCRKGELSLSWPISEERGNGSRYPFALLRDGLFAPSLKLERALIDPFFADRAETAARLEAQLAFNGRQLDAATRESITFTFASARIDAAKRTAKDARTIPEEITLIGETTDTLTPPLTVDVITTRDWSPST